MEIIKKILLKFCFLVLSDKRYGIAIFDSKNPPEEGDSITIGNRTAIFRKI